MWCHNHSAFAQEGGIFARGAKRRVEGVSRAPDFLIVQKQVRAAWYKDTIKVCYNMHMSPLQDKQLGNLVEQKILEFFGDPDSGLTLKKSFVAALKKRMHGSRKVVSNAAVAKRYGLR